MRNTFLTWVHAVCEQVRFWPDHRSIELELRDHYDDHVKDLLRLGKSQELAEERALEAMGNPQEVGWALDRVHKPWLGWLWEVSRVLVLALALLLAWKLWRYDSHTSTMTLETWNQLTWNVPASASHAATGYLDLWLAAGEPEPYQPLYYLEEVGPDETRVQVPLTLWVETRDVFHSDLEGLYDMEITADGQALPRGRTAEESGYWLYGPSKQGWTRYCDQIVLVLDSPPRRVEVTHPWGDWTLAAEWEGMS